MFLCVVTVNDFFQINVCEQSPSGVSSKRPESWSRIISFYTEMKLIVVKLALFISLCKSKNIRFILCLLGSILNFHRNLYVLFFVASWMITSLVRSTLVTAIQYLSVLVIRDSMEFLSEIERFFISSQEQAQIAEIQVLQTIFLAQYLYTHEVLIN